MRAIQSADKAKQMSPQEATRKGRRPCKDCISHIERAYDLDISRCTICRRMNILHDVPFSSYEIEYGHKENREGSICLNCQVSVLD
ncbi:MAG: hypothetical protein J07AB43_01740 [Candidatus Nanosalina sp. J07AB43]|nr:MAG: hypothetical protein J07AB43_01740 [Candidatus Nanosalina sp. J07AB43]